MAGQPEQVPPVNSGSSEPAASLRNARKQQRINKQRYGFACSNCRKRKSKCNGAFPACEKCLSSQHDCHYDKGPSVAYAAHLQHQLGVYRTQFELLQQATESERDNILQEAIASEAFTAKKHRFIDAEQVRRTETSPPDTPVHEGHDERSNFQQDETMDETSLGADGGVVFYGETSLYHIEPRGDGTEDQGETMPNRSDQGEVLEQQASTTATTYSMPESILSDQQESLSSFLADIPPDLLTELLNVYWCWPHHLHCVLCKKLFLRDLQSSGPCISPFLLSAVLAQAARYSTRADVTEVGDRFAKKALQLLVTEIDRGSSIPTIQGLLIYSARECACGRTSQGWLYSGMAFRMMRDLGLHIPPQRLGSLARHFTEEDLALRQQVFWSCYTWDKTMSLCLGRAPIIHDIMKLPTPDTLLDGNDADEEIWRPVIRQECPSDSLFRQKALSCTRFSAYCELCMIIDGILGELYSKPRRSRHVHLLTYLDDTLLKLEGWSSHLAPELFVASSARATLCPPVHILLLNLLYYATAILLCRPYRSISSKAKRKCTEAACMIDTLFTLHIRRFGFRSITYLQTYTMFVACTVNILDFRENQPLPDANEVDLNLAQESSARLDFGLEVLKQAVSTPSAARCAAIVMQLLERPNATKPRQQSLVGQTLLTSETGHGSHGMSHDHHLGSGGPGNTDKSCDGDGDVNANPVFVTSWGRNYRPSADGPQGGGSQDDQTSEMPFDMGTGGGQSLLPQHQQNAASKSSAPYANNVFATNDELGYSSIDTPLRWLGDNLRDDGSWMLMDINLDYLPMSFLQP
ncbi:hypothetical protein A1O1_06679 [Capronia coronata CBS 617.96]|uniref:Zn(2)-C6 fungal-type domain-containing protein n=1 Tax=Capronia coronata CBS 617.96 TaxID=1182541 RepID=W9Y1E8_9EURO|nr:uncharacterized protein A1O1_06679 [Capronia coronata CBS 617.96]EXJ83061.1 hypothetical protein A1O1_06679 [Capronia coronata CBS 617.96]